MKKWLVLSLIVFSIHTIAKTAVYFPNRGDSIGQISWAPTSRFYSDNVFTNPAALAYSDQYEMDLNAKAGVLDYSNLNLSTTLPTKPYTIGIGLDYTYSDAAQEVSYDGFGPTIDGTIKDAYYQLSTGVGTALSSELLIGGRVNIKHQELYTQSATAISVDGGLIWHQDKWAVQAYTNDLLSTPFKWTSGVESTLSSAITAEVVTWQFYPIQASVGMTTTIDGDSESKLTGEFHLMEELLLFTTLRNRSDVATTQIGMHLNMGEKVQLKYIKTNINSDEFTLSEDAIGIGVYF